MATDATEACRHTIAMARQLSGELDPAKPEHLAVVGDLLALFTHSLGEMVPKIFSRYLQPKNKAELSEALMTLFYGGRDLYQHRNPVKKIVAQLKRHRSTAGGQTICWALVLLVILPHLYLFDFAWS